MKRFAKILAATVAAITAISCASVPSFADKLRKDDGVLYRYSDSGENKGKYTGWVKTSKGKYYYKNGVKLKNKWLKYKGKRTYYLQNNGLMATNTVNIDGKDHIFGADGKLLPDNFGITLKFERITHEKLTISCSQDTTGIDFTDTPTISVALHKSYIEQLTENGWERFYDKNTSDDNHGYVTLLCGENKGYARYTTNGGEPLPH